MAPEPGIGPPLLLGMTHATAALAAASAAAAAAVVASATEDAILSSSSVRGLVCSGASGVWGVRRGRAAGSTLAAEHSIQGTASIA